MRKNYDPADRPQLEERLINLRLGGATYEEICALPGWPTRPTLRRWLREKPALRDQAREGRRIARTARPYPYDPAVAQSLIERVRCGQTIKALIREPGMPHRRALNAWKKHDPVFAADLEAAKAVADGFHRRRGRRRASLRYTDEASDRVIGAVLKGGTLPEICRDRAMPSPLALKRWRRAHPEFDGALKLAIRTGYKARGRRRVDGHCTPDLTARIEEAIIAGASLHSLSKQPDMPGLYALYKWVRDRPDFAAAVARACRFRDEMQADQALALIREHGPAAEAQAKAIFKRLGQQNPYPGEQRERR